MGLLETIVGRKRAEIAAAKQRPPAPDVVARRPRDFAAALRTPGMSVIAEIKRRSPTKGGLRPELDAVALARDYEGAGAAAISCLNDEPFFGAQPDDLARASRAVAIPVLCKDFVVDEWQIHEARRRGADAVLLIARILTPAELVRFLDLCREFQLAALVEVHSESELNMALAASAEIIGINNRDLDSFEVSLATGLRLRKRIPTSQLAVAESGIHSRADVVMLEHAGFDAILVGEALLTAANPAARLAELRGVTGS